MFISIFSPKGGVGKTTLALALADIISKTQKTCIVEFDFSPGDFAAILNIDKNFNVLKAIRLGIDEAIQRPEGKRFDVITGGYPDTHEKIPPEVLRNFVRELKQKYDVVLADIQPGLIEDSIVMLQESDKILNVVEDTKQVAVRTARILNWGQENGSIDWNKIAVVANKVRGKIQNYIEGTVTYKIPLFNGAVTYNNKALQKCLVPFVNYLMDKYSKGLFSKSVKDIDVQKLQIFVNNIMNQLLNAGEDNGNVKNVQNIEVKNITKESAYMVYINTNIKTLNDVLKDEIKNVAENFDECNIAVVSGMSKDDIDKFSESNKKIILLTTDNLKQYAYNKGIHCVFADECSISDIVSVIHSIEGEDKNVQILTDEKVGKNTEINNVIDTSDTSEVEEEVIETPNEMNINEKTDAVSLEEVKNDREIRIVIDAINRLVEIHTAEYKNKISKIENELKDANNRNEELEKVITEKDKEIENLKYELERRKQAVIQFKQLLETL